MRLPFESSTEFLSHRSVTGGSIGREKSEIFSYLERLDSFRNGPFDSIKCYGTINVRIYLPSTWSKTSQILARDAAPTPNLSQYAVRALTGCPRLSCRATIVSAMKKNSNVNFHSKNIVNMARYWLVQIILKIKRFCLTGFHQSK